MERVYVKTWKSMHGIKLTTTTIYLRGGGVRLIRQTKSIFSIIFFDDTVNIYLFLQ